MNRPIDIAKCCICSGHHRDLTTYPLLPTVTIDRLTYVRYGICPESKHTIYLAYDKTTLVNIPSPAINFPKEVKVSMEKTWVAAKGSKSDMQMSLQKDNGFICVPEDIFEHLLNCLDNQKFFPVPDQQSAFEKDMQAIIDELNCQLREFLNS